VDADRRDDHAQLACDLAAHDADAGQQRPAGAAVGERHEAEADRELERIDRQRPDGRVGIFGRPGTSAIAQIAPPATSGALRWSKIWLAMSLPRSFSDAERVTMMPVATEMSRAGIWAARPSPTVSSEKCEAASPNGIPCCMTPTMIPPTRLIMTMSTAATASPLTNFDAPSIAP
jgi:hypothetical protein